jgi:hypothetical protein
MKTQIDRISGLRVAVLGFAMIIGLAAAPLQSATAATAPIQGAGNGLRVSPVRKDDIVIQPGGTQTIEISVTNVTGGAASFQAIVNDFIANPNESGNPAIILDPAKFAPGHSLKRFIGPINVISLQPGEEKSVSVKITVPANASGGGYYGAVRFAPASNNTQPNQVSLSGSVGTLLLVKVPGDIKEHLSIAGVGVYSGGSSSNFFTSNKNLSVRVRFQNEGNIQESPFGKLQVKNRANKTLGSYEINNISPAANVLPDSIRRFEVPIKTGKLGQYKIEGNFGYGSSGQLLSVATTIYIIPLSLIIIFIAVVVLLALSIFGIPRLLKAYNRRVLRRAGRR